MSLSKPAELPLSSSAASVLGKRESEEDEEEKKKRSRVWINLTRAWQDNVKVMGSSATVWFKWTHSYVCITQEAGVTPRDLAGMSCPSCYSHESRIKAHSFNPTDCVVTQGMDDTVTIRFDDADALFFWCEVKLREAPPLPLPFPAELVDLVCEFADMLSINGHVLQPAVVKGRLSCNTFHVLHAESCAHGLQVSAYPPRDDVHPSIDRMRVSISFA